MFFFQCGKIFVSNVSYMQHMAMHGGTAEPKIDKPGPKSKPLVSSKKAGLASTKGPYFPYRTTTYTDCDSIECCNQVSCTYFKIPILQFVRSYFNKSFSVWEGFCLNWLLYTSHGNA